MGHSTDQDLSALDCQHPYLKFMHEIGATEEHHIVITTTRKSRQRHFIYTESQRSETVLQTK